MHYRAEIDGLRGIAVIPVIFFHAGFELFSGGYVGVDIFFVISGYLITTIILVEKEKDKFNLINFYERRARRILPALFFVMAICIPFAWYLYMPFYMKDFAQSLVAVSTFSSNILFWREISYFAQAAELKPLLHTWSLALEEQYYILFPLFLILTWKLGRHWILVILVSVAIISLSFAHWGAYNHPTANYYLLPTRGWEILIGVLIAFYLVKKEEIKGNQWLSFAGLGMIIYSIVVFNKTTPFPSLYTLMPTIGVALIILYASPSTMVCKFLKNKIFVWIGLVSYSAYLWHQPLFAFAKYQNPTRDMQDSIELSFIVCSILIGATFLIAYFSYHFVETPFRKNKIKGSNVFKTSAFISVLLMGGLGLVLIQTSNYPRFDSSQRAVLKIQKQGFEIMKSSGYDKFGCFIDYSQEAKILVDLECVKPSTNPRFILFGDSEAAHYSEGLKRSANQYKFDAYQWTGASCRFFDFKGNNSRCRNFQNLFEQTVIPSLTEKDVIILSSNILSIYNNIGSDKFKSALRKTISKFEGSDAEIVIFGASPEFLIDPFEQLIQFGDKKKKSAWTQWVTPSVVKFDVDNYLIVNSDIKMVADEFDIKYFSPASLLCPDKKNPLKCIFKEDNNNYLFFDNTHLSFEGSERVVNFFLKGYFK